MTPALIEPPSPNGLPIAYASLPWRTAPGLPRSAGTMFGRRLGRADDRDVVLGLAGDDLGRPTACRRRTSA